MLDRCIRVHVLQSPGTHMRAHSHSLIFTHTRARALHGTIHTIASTYSLTHVRARLFPDVFVHCRIFDEVEADGARKNEEIDGLKERLSKMRREFEGTKAKVEAAEREKALEQAMIEAEK